MVDAHADALTMRVKLRVSTLGDLALLTRMAVRFSDEDRHRLLRGGRAALKTLCIGTPHGQAFMIEDSDASSPRIAGADSALPR